MSQTGDPSIWRLTDGGAQGQIDESWSQGRAAYGGLVVGGALRAMATLVPEGRALRSVMVSFVGPAAPGAVEARVRVLRSGRSVTQVHGEVVQGADVRAVVLGIWGITRATELAMDGPPPPDVPEPMGLMAMPYMPGLTPAFTQHFDYRWTIDSFPFSGSPEPHVQGWVRPRWREPVDAIGLVTMLDAWPSPIITRATRPIPMSSVSWQVQLLQPLPHEGVSAEQFWLYDARTIASQGGYEDFAGRLYDRQGQLVAMSRQLVAEFSGR